MENLYGYLKRFTSLDVNELKKMNKSSLLYHHPIAMTSSVDFHKVGFCGTTMLSLQIDNFGPLIDLIAGFTSL